MRESNNYAWSADEWFGAVEQLWQQNKYDNLNKEQFLKGLVMKATGQLFGFRLFFAQHILHRRADWLICSVNTAHPATRPAHPFLEFTDQPFNMLLSRLVFLNKGNPAYPLIARKWRKILPYC